jgi:LacI family transcriptional regulator
LAKYNPDAIVCSNDVAALSLSKTLAKLNVRIPEDIMLAGFDDVVEAGRMNPPLTSIRQPCFELATMAFRTLLERIDNPDLPPRQILLDTSLVVRESTSKRC